MNIIIRYIQTFYQLSRIKMQSVVMLCLYVILSLSIDLYLVDAVSRVLGWIETGIVLTKELMPLAVVFCVAIFIRIIIGKAKNHLLVSIQANCHQNVMRNVLSGYSRGKNQSLVSNHRLYSILFADCYDLSHSGIKIVEEVFEWIVSFVGYCLFGLLHFPLVVIVFVFVETFVLLFSKTINHRLNEENAQRREKYHCWLEFVSSIIMNMEACMGFLDPKQVAAASEKKAECWFEKCVVSLDTMLKVDGIIKIGRIASEIILLVYAYILWENGQGIAGSIFSAIVIVQQLSQQMQVIPDHIDDIQKVSILMDQLQKIDARNEALSICITKKPEKRDVAVCLNHVSFQYDIQNTIINDYSKEFMFGKSYGIIGESGSGKSTLLKIIAGYLSPLNGTISIDYDQVFFSGQNIFIDGSLHDNITFGSEQDDERYHSLIEHADFLQRLEHVEHIQSNGQPLSSGEKQMVLLYRILYKQPQIIVLDEPFANLSIENEKIFMKSIKDHLPEACIIVVSHRINEASLFDELIEMGGIL